MYRELDRVTPDSLTYLLEDNFKYITLYNNRLLSAKGTAGQGQLVDHHRGIDRPKGGHADTWAAKQRSP